VTSLLPTGDALRTLIRGHLAAFERRPEDAAGERRAAVAITVLDVDTAPQVLVLKRAPRGLNAGQWALPGGKLQPEEDAVAGALRELAEEAGVQADAACVAGRLDDYVTASGFCITPVVVLAPPGARLVRDEREIQSLHPIALDRLVADDVPRWKPTADGGRLLQMPLRHDMVVHAPTGAILLQFREVALRGTELRIGDLLQPEFTHR
jgi:8-oxo-dGTP pyrophosphatase MutT (NUDIX family)